MKYGITEEIATSGQTKSLYPTRLGGGFHENLELIHIGFEPVKEGSESKGLRFTWSNEGGQYSYFEFLPDADAEVTRITSVLKRINDIAKTYAPKEVVQSAIQGETLTDLFKSVVTLIKPLADGQLARIKLVLNDKDYAEFTRYAGFIENMNVVKTGLRQGRDERFEKTEKKGVETFGSSEGVLSSFTTGDTLPF